MKMMFNSFAKKFATFTGERVPLEATRSGAVLHLYAHNVLFFLTFLSIFSITFSIAVSAVFLGLAIACWLYILIRHPQWERCADCSGLFPGWIHRSGAAVGDSILRS
jgi:hypothetical protein